MTQETDIRQDSLILCAQDTFIPPPLRAEINATGGARAKITVYISQPQQQLTSGVAIPTSAPVKLQLDRRKTVRLLTFNTMLLPPMLTKHDPNKRAALIADRILAEGYDAVCLQEVLHGPARQIIVDRLKDHYPYIVAKTAPNVNINLAAADLEHMLRVGKDSGLFFASKFPIARQEFKIYGVGAGTDSLVQKGCLGIKLDCSSIVPVRYNEQDSLLVIVEVLLTIPFPPFRTSRFSFSTLTFRPTLTEVSDGSYLKCVLQEPLGLVKCVQSRARLCIPLYPIGSGLKSRIGDPLKIWHSFALGISIS